MDSSDFVAEEISEVGALRNTGEILSSHAMDVKENWTASEMVRKVQEGTICKGMYLTDNMREEVEDKDTVVVIEDSLKFKGTVSEEHIMQRACTSQRMTDIFERNVDKIVPKEEDVGENLNLWEKFELRVPPEDSDFDRQQSRKQENAFLSVVSYQRIPVKAVDLTLDDMTLHPVVIKKLKSVETSLREFDYEPMGHFNEFFKRFGSHVNVGVVEFGGILMSTATCEGFKEEQREKYKATASKHSKVALNLGFKEVGPIFKAGVSFNHSNLHDGSSGQDGEQLDSIITLRKLGGPPEVNDQDSWREALVRSKSHWRVINRAGNNPVGIWKLIERHKEEFEDFEKLGDAMGQDYENSKNENKYDRLVNLREWLETKGEMPDEMINALKELNLIREKLHTDETWRAEVLDSVHVLQYLHRVTVEIPQATTLDQLEVKRYLREIIDKKTHGQLDEHRFPLIKQIIDFLREESNDGVKPFNLKNITELPEIIDRYRTQADLQQNIKEKYVQDIQERIEQCVKTEQKTLEYITCVAVMTRHGFNVNSKAFESDHQRFELEQLAIELKDEFRTLDQAASKQAHVINIAINCGEQAQDMLQLFLRLWDDLDKKVLKVLENFKDNLPALKVEIQSLLIKGELDLKQLVAEINSQLSSDVPECEQLSIQESMAPVSVLKEPVEKLLRELHLFQYYPQGLTYDMALTITADVFNFSQKPKKLSDLPWYFIRHIIALDYTARESYHLEEGSDIHPLDLIYVIFLCADDFLRQELADKMTTCQYAVPFILPEPSEDEGSHGTLLHWGLKSITRMFSCRGEEQTKALVDVEAPLVTLMTLGEESPMKSRVMNKILGSKCDPFWHQELEGGECEQTVSEGMVEVAWYLPGGGTHDAFQQPTIFTNVRGNSLHHSKLAERLVESSSMVCLFADEINDKLVEFFRTIESHLHKVCLIMEKKCRQVKEKLEEFHLKEDQIVSHSGFNPLFKTLMKKIKVEPTECQPNSLSKIAEKVSLVDGFFVDDLKWQEALSASQAILAEIDQLSNEDPQIMKAKILPYQSELNARRRIADLDKELYLRQRRKDDVSFESHVRDVQEKKWKLRFEILQLPISETFRYFLQFLRRFDSTRRKYFLQSLKLGLNQRSVDIHRPLNEEYDKIRKQHNGEDRIKKLQEMWEKLANTSFGIENFFREMAVIYENILALKKQCNTWDLDGSLDFLSKLMADLFLEGTAIEIMDGDAGDVPVAWLSAVLHHVENSDTATAYRVSVLGAQSSGKSTMLNTAFGLHFPVSSGRCTRGAYMQLVRVDEQLRLGFEYLLTIDTEGLMSKFTKVSMNYDNELATFVIGMSDLTLVNNKGEGTEMQEILPLAVSVFLKMSLLGDNQACHFVYQNSSGVGVETAVAPEIDRFVKNLDDQTRAAAAYAGVDPENIDFKKVLHYDAETDNTFVPNLWDGTPPMAPANVEYCAKMQELKHNIIRNTTDLKSGMKKSFCSLIDFGKRIEKLWTAIKQENFLLSFRNALEVEAYSTFSKVFDKHQWESKRRIRELLQKEETQIKNAFKSSSDEINVSDRIHSSRKILNQTIVAEYNTLEQNMEHYFSCMNGCENCDKSVKNRRLLKHRQNHFTMDAKTVADYLKKEVESSLKTVEETLEAQKHVQKMSTIIDHNIKRNIIDLIAEKAKLPTEEDEREDCDRVKEQVEESFKAAATSLGLENLFANESTNLQKAGVLQGKAIQIFDGIHTKLKTYDSSEAQPFDRKMADELTTQLVNEIRLLEQNDKSWTTEFSEQLVLRVRDLAVQTFTEMSWRCELEPHFNRLWSAAKQDVLGTVRRLPSQSDTASVKVLVERSIKTALGNDCDVYYQKRSNIATKGNDGVTDKFSVTQRHVTPLHSKTGRSRFDMDRLRQKTEDQIKSIQEELDKYEQQEAKPFQQSMADELFDKLHKEATQMKDHTFKTTKDYANDMILHVEDMAVKAFTKMNERYQKETSPEVLLEKRKNAYRQVFLIKMGQGGEAQKFCKTVLKDMILKNMKIRMSSTELLESLRALDVDNTFRDARSLQAAKMIDLLTTKKEDQFEGLLELINFYQKSLKQFIMHRSTELFDKERNFYKLANQKLDSILGIILEATVKTAESPCDGESFIKTFLDNVTNLERPDNGDAFLDMNVADKDEFSTIVRQLLNGPLRAEISQQISEWSIARQLQNKDFAEFVFKELVVCSATCPFCGAPCDVHSGGKREGDHSASIHRPMGLAGNVTYRYGGFLWLYRLEKLSLSSCCEIVDSGQSFKTEDGWEKYCDYRKVFPDWDIKRAREHNVEKYWKWMLAHHNKNLSRHFKEAEAKVPMEWKAYTTQDIIREVETKYEVKFYDSTHTPLQQMCTKNV